jgi:hypothetical protein
MGCSFISIVSPSGTRAEPNNSWSAAGADADPKHAKTEIITTMPKRPFLLAKYLKGWGRRIIADLLLQHATIGI